MRTLRTRFLRVSRRLVCSVGDYWQKSLRRSSGGSLSRVRCWLGTQASQHLHIYNMMYIPTNQGWKWKLRRNMRTLRTPFFCTFGAPTCMLSRWLLNQKFLHRSSPGSLLRVRCWLGSQQNKEKRASHFIAKGWVWLEEMLLLYREAKWRFCCIWAKLAFK